MLADQPNSGKARPDLGDGLRSFPVGRYLVFYRPSPVDIDVIRILSSFRRITPEAFAEH